METTLTVEKLVNAYMAMERVGQLDGIAAGPSWWIARNLRNWKEDYESYHKARLELFQKYGNLVDDAEGGQKWEIPPANLDAFSIELRGLLDVTLVTNVTVHDIEFLGIDAIQPEYIHRLKFVLKRPDQVATTQVEYLRYSELAELYAAISSAATYKLPIDLSWWVASILEQVEDKVIELNLAQLKARVEKSDVQDLLRKFTSEKYPINYTSRSISELTTVLTDWKPTMFAPLIFALTEE